MDILFVVACSYICYLVLAESVIFTPAPTDISGRRYKQQRQRMATMGALLTGLAGLVSSLGLHLAPAYTLAVMTTVTAFMSATLLVQLRQTHSRMVEEMGDGKKHL